MGDNFKISYKMDKKLNNKALKFLLDTCTTLEIKTIIHLIYLANNNNVIKYVNDNSTQAELSSIFKTDRRTIKLLFNKLRSLGIYSQVDSSWILNPYISCTSETIMTKELYNTFKDAVICKSLNIEQISKLDLSEISNEDNLYVIAQEVQNRILYKLGYSSNIRKRLQQYMYHNPGIQLIKTLYREDAKEIEKAFHAENLAIYLKEWYEINPLKKL